MEDSRCLTGRRERQKECKKQGNGVKAAGEGEGRGVWDGLINRVSDSTLFCLWDKSNRVHRRSAALGNCG